MEAKLQKLSYIKIEALWGNEDVTLEDIFAKIRIQNKGTIMFLQLTPESFEGGQRIIISQIADLHPRVTGYGYNGVISSTGQPIKSSYWGYAVEVTGDGPFVSQFPFDIGTVEDAIAHYDDIKSVMEKWPRCPDYQIVNDSSGGIHCYCVGHESSRYPEGCAR